MKLHPSRVVRFLGNPLPGPSLAGALWSDSVLQVLHDGENRTRRRVDVSVLGRPPARQEEPPS